MIKEEKYLLCEKKGKHYLICGICSSKSYINHQIFALKPLKFNPFKIFQNKEKKEGSDKFLVNLEEKKRNFLKEFDYFFVIKNKLINYKKEILKVFDELKVFKEGEFIFYQKNRKEI